MAAGFVGLGGFVGFGGLVGFAVVVVVIATVVSTALHTSHANGGEKPDPLMHVTIVAALVAQYPALHCTK